MYGLSFQPGSEQSGSNGNGEKKASAPVQEAVRLLSLRLPSVVGARALAPQTLLNAPGSAGLTGPGGMSVDAMIEWLRKQMQQSGASLPSQAGGIFNPASMAQSQSGVPTPRFGAGAGETGSGPTSRPDSGGEVYNPTAPPIYNRPVTPPPVVRPGDGAPEPVVEATPSTPYQPEVTLSEPTTAMADPWEEQTRHSWIPDDRGDDYWRG
jgi:hypothetical protein